MTDDFGLAERIDRMRVGIARKMEQAAAQAAKAGLEREKARIAAEIRDELRDELHASVTQDVQQSLRQVMQEEISMAAQSGVLPSGPVEEV